MDKVEKATDAWKTQCEFKVQHFFLPYFLLNNIVWLNLFSGSVILRHAASLFSVTRSLWLTVRCQAGIRLSSGCCQLVVKFFPGGYQVVVRWLSGDCQVVVWWLSGSCRPR